VGVSDDGKQQLDKLSDDEIGNTKQATPLICGLSDCGRIRQTNEDQLFVAELS
jgi:hypothetical protein